MFLKYIDQLSPPITLYYKGDSSHKSIFSGIMTLFFLVISFSFGIYYLLDFIIHKDPTSYFYNRFVSDVGSFPLNATSMFHYIYLYDLFSMGPSKIDLGLYRIIGIQDLISLYKVDNDLSKYNHWLYESCEDTDIKPLEQLFKDEAFPKYLCISKYYNKEDNKYYDKKSPYFKWPSIDHGVSNPMGTYYGVIVE